MIKIFPLVLLYMTGCASMVNSTRQEISISANQMGAQAKSDSGLMCNTPCSLDLSRKMSHIITVEKEGYESINVTINNSVSGWIAGNILFGGLIGLVIDFVSGGAYKLQPETVEANLIKKDVSKMEERKYQATSIAMSEFKRFIEMCPKGRRILLYLVNGTKHAGTLIDCDNQRYTISVRISDGAYDNVSSIHYKKIRGIKVHRE